MGDTIALRKLDKWNDHDAEPIADQHRRELEDSAGNKPRWTPEEMFKYNEKIHKIFSNYNEDTYSSQYSTPLPKGNSKATIRVASRLAKEIQTRIQEDGGRVTPESSDDDDLFDAKHKLKANKQLDQLWQLQQLKRLLANANKRKNGDLPELSNETFETVATTKSNSNYSKTHQETIGDSRNSGASSSHSCSSGTTATSCNNKKTNSKQLTNIIDNTNSFNLAALAKSLVSNANLLTQGNKNSTTKKQAATYPETQAKRSKNLQVSKKERPTVRLGNTSCSSEVESTVSMSCNNRAMKPISGSSSRNILRSCLV